MPAASIPQDRGARPPVRQLHTIHEALALLARSKARIAPLAPGAMAARAFAVHIGDDEDAAPLAHLDATLLRALHAAHCIVATGRPPAWRLSEHGKALLKRARSGAGAPTPPAPGRTEAAQEAAAAPEPQIDLAESPLGWLRRRKGPDGKPLLSDAQFAAGERLRADFHFAQLTPRVTMSWSAAAVPGARPSNPAGGGVDQTDRAMAARERVNRSLHAVGPELSGILVDVCCHLKGLEDVEDVRGWAKRSAKVVLDLALNALARHYGYLATPAPDRQRHIRHWGSDDFKPTAEQWGLPQASPPARKS